MISINSIGGTFPLVRLEEAVDFLDSKRRPVTESDRQTGPYPYYGANGQQGTMDAYIFDEPLLLLAEDGGHFGEPDRGIAYRISGKTWVNNHAHVLRPKMAFDIAYLCRVLENYDVTPFVTGTTRGKLTKAGASRIVVPQPPIAEQRRLARILDAADALRLKRRATIVELDKVVPALFYDAFGDPANNDRSLPCVPLIDLVHPNRPISYGILMPGPDHAGGVKYVRVVDMQDGGVDLSRIRKTTPEISNSFRRSLLKPGDLLLSIRGHVGRLALVPHELDGANITQDTARLAFQNISPVYMREYLRSDNIQRWMATHTKGVAVRGINLSDVKRLPVLIPPLSLQHEFARRVAAVEKLKAAHRASLTELDALFASLQHRAFRGEL